MGASESLQGFAGKGSLHNGNFDQLIGGEEVPEEEPLDLLFPQRVPLHYFFYEGILQLSMTLSGKRKTAMKSLMPFLMRSRKLKESSVSKTCSGKRLLDSLLVKLLFLCFVSHS